MTMQMPIPLFPLDQNDRELIVMALNEFAAMLDGDAPPTALTDDLRRVALSVEGGSV